MRYNENASGYKEFDSRVKRTEHASSYKVLKNLNFWKNCSLKNVKLDDFVRRVAYAVHIKRSRLTVLDSFRYSSRYYRACPDVAYPNHFYTGSTWNILNFSITLRDLSFFFALDCSCHNTGCIRQLEVPTRVPFYGSVVSDSLRIEKKGY